MSWNFQRSCQRWQAKQNTSWSFVRWVLKLAGRKWCHLGYVLPRHRNFYSPWVEGKCKVVWKRSWQYSSVGRSWEFGRLYTSVWGLILKRNIIVLYPENIRVAWNTQLYWICVKSKLNHWERRRIRKVNS